MKVLRFLKILVTEALTNLFWFVLFVVVGSLVCSLVYILFLVIGDIALWAIGASETTRKEDLFMSGIITTFAVIFIGDAIREIARWIIKTWRSLP